MKITTETHLLPKKSDIENRTLLSRFLERGMLSITTRKGRLHGWITTEGMTRKIPLKGLPAYLKQEELPSMAQLLAESYLKFQGEEIEVFARGLGGMRYTDISSPDFVVEPEKILPVLALALTALDVAGREIEEVREILNSIDLFPNLKTLQLSGCSALKDKDLKKVTKKGTLRKVDLTGCVKVSALMIEKLLEDNQMMHQLILRENHQLEEDDLEDILIKGKNLHSISFEGCEKLNDEEVLRKIEEIGEKFAMMKVTLPSGKKIKPQLKKKEIPELLSVPLEAIPFSETLTALDLSGQSHTKACEILNRLEAFSNLKILDLSGCSKLTDRDLEPVTKIRGLQEIALSGVNVSAYMIGRLLNANQNVERLLLNDNPQIEERDLHGIFGCGRNLRYISFAGCKQLKDEAILSQKTEFGQMLHQRGITLTLILPSRRELQHWIEESIEDQVAHYGEDHPFLVKSLTSFRREWDEAKKKQVQEFYEKEVRNKEEKYGKNHPEVAASLVGLGFAHFTLAEEQKTVEYCMRALQIYREAPGNHELHKAHTLLQLACASSGKESIGYAEEALRVYEENAEVHPCMVLTLHNLGVAWEELGEHKKAIEYYEQALKVQKVLYGDTLHEEVGDALCGLGACWGELGEHKKAIEYYKQALKVQKALYGDIPHEEVGDTLHNLGVAWESLDECKKAIEYYEKALKERKAFYGDTPHAEMGYTLYNLGVCWGRFGKRKKAIEYYEQALKVQKALYGDTPHEEVGNTLYALGVCWGICGEPTKAMEHYEQALKVQKALYGNTPHKEMGDILYTLGVCWGIFGEPMKAIEYHEQALKERKALYGDTPNEDVGDTLHNLGVCWGKLGERTKAIGYYEQAFKERQALYGDTPREEVGDTLYNLGVCWGKLGEPTKAIEYHERALKEQQVLYGDTPRKKVGKTLYNLGECWRAIGEYRKAIECYEEALSIRKALFSDSPNEEVGDTLHTLGGCWASLGEYTKAIEYYEQALKVRKALYGGTPHKEGGDTLHTLGACWGILGERKKAIEYYEQALKERKALYGDTPHKEVGDILHTLGACWGILGERKKAIEYYEQALKERKALYGDTPHKEVGNTLYALGIFWGILGERKKAIEYYEQALKVRKALYGDTPHKKVENILHNLEVCWRNLGKYAKARECYKQALKVQKDALR